MPLGGLKNISGRHRWKYLILNIVSEGKAGRLQHELYSYENKWPFALDTYLELTPLVWLSKKNQ